MEGLLERLGAARAQLAKLLEERDRLSKAVETLEAGARETGREADVLRARIKELEQENAVLRNAPAALPAAGHEGTKEEIEELVEELDRCLALLNT
jgi:septal ring factor EnvC (AmiA/AmiB activator)